MSKRLHMTKQLVEIKVTEISKNGYGLGIAENSVGNSEMFEIPFTLPGDVIKAEIIREKENANLASLKSIVKPSPLRVTPKCVHFTTCGGCRLQHIPYKGQLLHKEKIIRDCFANLISEKVVVHPIVAAKTPWHYRNKMDYTFSSSESGKLQLGLIQEGTKGSVLNINECFLSSQWFLDALICVKRWWETSKIPAYDPVNNKGVLRYLTLREGRRSGDRMVILSIANRNDFEFHIRHIEKFVSQIAEYVKPHQEENELSIYLRILQANEGTTSNQYDMLLYGPGFIRESLKIAIDSEMENQALQFEVGPSSFFQPNPQQAEALYSTALKMAKLTPESVVYDLYCGTGTIGICASKFVKKVIGIELSPETAANARANVKLNNVDNFFIYSGAVRHVLSQLQAGGVPAPDIVIVNPPRVGLDFEAMAHLLELKPPTILYISCYPSSQAMDVETLFSNGYTLTDLQPVDKFPQTNHVENIALLKR